MPQVLRHRLLDDDGQPIAGKRAAVAVHDLGLRLAPGTYRRVPRAVAVSGPDGWLEWTLPRQPGATFVVSGIEDQQVLVSVPTDVSTTTVDATRTGTIPFPPGDSSQNGLVDLVTEAELVSRLATLVTEDTLTERLADLDLPSAPTTDAERESYVPARLSTTALRAAFPPRGASLAVLGARGKTAQRMLTAFQSGHGYTANAGGTHNLNDTSDFALGSQSVSVITDGAGTAKTVKRVAQTAVDGTGKHAKVWVKVPAQAKVAGLQLYLGDTNLANYWRWELKNSASQPWMHDGQWTVWTLPFGQAAVTGTPTRTAITDVQLRVQDDATGPVTAQFGGVALVNTSSAFPAGVVSFTFDDTYLSTYTQGRAYLDRYGFSGTAYVIQDYVGQSGRMTLTQLHALEQLSGWEVAGHATTGAAHNARITSMTDAQVRAEFAGIRDWLQVNGFAGDHYAYPGGEYLSHQAAIAEEFFTGARTVYQRPETHPPARPGKLRSKGYVTSSVTVAVLTAAIDQAAANGEWLIISNHDLVTTVSGTTDQTIADFQAVVDYVNTKGIPVRTVGEVLRTRP